MRAASTVSVILVVLVATYSIAVPKSVAGEAAHCGRRPGPSACAVPLTVRRGEPWSAVAQYAERAAQSLVVRTGAGWTRASRSQRGLRHATAPHPLVSSCGQ
jgi:hypothetical protein